MTTVPSDEFQDACYQAANALRLITHAIRRSGEMITTSNSAILNTFQTRTTFEVSDEGILITVDPKSGIDDGHKFTRFLLKPENLPGSALFSTSPKDLPELFAGYVEQVLGNGAMSMIHNGGQDFCILFTPAQGSRVVIQQYVEAIARGIDAKYDPNTVLMRHPGFGVSGAIEMISPDEQIVTPSPEDEDADRRACAARMHMAKLWVHHLPQAIMVQPLAIPNLFTLTPFGMTFAAPEDRPQAMSHAIKAYMHLAELTQQQQATF